MCKAPGLIQVPSIKYSLAGSEDETWRILVFIALAVQ